MGAFLVAHRGALGDFIQTWISLSSLKLQYRDLNFIGLGRPDYMQLARELGLIDVFYNCESAEFLPFFSGDALPRVLGNLEHALLWMERNERVSKLLLQACKGRAHIHPPFPETKGHVLHHQLSVLPHFGLPEPSEILPWFPLDTKPGDMALIHPGSGSSSKNFNPEFYSFLANELIGTRFVDTRIVLGPGEKDLVNQFRSRHKIEEPGSAVDLARLLAGAKLFIGNDSGVSHLAAVLGVPTIALYKSDNHMRWGVRGPCAQCLQVPNEELAMGRILKAIELIELGQVPVARL